jgi:hypothetical protein
MMISSSSSSWEEAVGGEEEVHNRAGSMELAVRSNRIGAVQILNHEKKPDTGESSRWGRGPRLIADRLF